MHTARRQPPQQVAIRAPYPLNSLKVCNAPAITADSYYDPHMRHVMLTTRTAKPEVATNIAALIDAAGKHRDGVRRITIAAPKVRRSQRTNLPAKPALWDLGGSGAARDCIQFVAGPKGERVTHREVVSTRYPAEHDRAGGRMLFSQVEVGHHIVFAARADQPDFAHELPRTYAVAVYRIDQILPLTHLHPRFDGRLDGSQELVALNLSLVALESVGHTTQREVDPGQIQQLIPLIDAARRKLSGPQRRAIHFEAIWEAPWRQAHAKEHFVSAEPPTEQVTVVPEDFVTTVHQLVSRYRDDLIAARDGRDLSCFYHLPLGCELTVLDGERVQLAVHLPRRHHTMRGLCPDAIVTTVLSGIIPESLQAESAFAVQAQTVEKLVTLLKWSSETMTLSRCLLTAR